MTRGLVLFRGHEKEPTMRASRIHFEQIPVEVVKKIAEIGVFSRDQKSSTDNVMVERIAKRTGPQIVPARLPVRKGR